MAEETSMGGSLWKGANSFLGVAGLASALGIGIPALVKANDAQDDDRRGRAPEQSRTFLLAQKYADDKYLELFKEQANMKTDIALTKQAQEYQQRINDINIGNVYSYVNSNFMRGQLYLPSRDVTPLPMNRFNAWAAPVFPLPPVAEATSTSTTSTSTSEG